jgi:hypothetical protein
MTNGQEVLCELAKDRLERAEICGNEWRTWTYIDDAIVAKLRTRGNRTKTRFLPGKEFFWESLLAHAQTNTPHRVQGDIPARDRRRR